jgi:hypothetical protein
MCMKYELVSMQHPPAMPLLISGKNTLDGDVAQPFCLSDKMNNFTQRPL